MSYLVLARKWRPRQFVEMVGQEHVLRALINALDSGRLHHAFLFSGTRGVGKTTVARLLAKALNCECGVSSTPCGVCQACREIDEGRFIDLIEVDAASRTKVDETRELLDNVQYAPTRGRYKVYLIDEVHMLSAHSFNALLKTLEEPPPHVKFLLATTDPQKLPVTVLSRCLQFNLKSLPPALIQERLRTICESEQVPAEPAALRQLALSAQGSMRDALSLLDQAIAFCGGDLHANEVQSMLGGIDRRDAQAMLGALARGDGAALMAEVARIDENAPDYATVLNELATLLQRVALAQVVAAAITDEEERRELAPLIEALRPEEVQLHYQIALVGRRDLPLSSDPRVGFEMTLLRMLAFRPDGAPESAQTGGGASGPGASARVASTRSSTGDSAAGSRSRPVGPSTQRTSAVTRAGDGDTPAAAGEWSTLLDALPLQGGARQLAAHCALESHEGSLLRLKLDKAHEHLLTTQLQERLRAALENHFAERVELRIEIGSLQAETPARRDARLADERRQGARESLERDPNVTALQSELGASFVPDSIEPLS
jgi:DNA polymerase-3 subunit gamma/tau